MDNNRKRNINSIDSLNQKPLKRHRLSDDSKYNDSKSNNDDIDMDMDMDMNNNDNAFLTRLDIQNMLDKNWSLFDLDKINNVNDMIKKDVPNINDILSNQIIDLPTKRNKISITFIKNNLKKIYPQSRHLIYHIDKTFEPSELNRWLDIYDDEYNIQVNGFIRSTDIDLHMYNNLDTSEAIPAYYYHFNKYEFKNWKKGQIVYFKMEKCKIDTINRKNMIHSLNLKPYKKNSTKMYKNIHFYQVKKWSWIQQQDKTENDKIDKMTFQQLKRYATKIGVKFTKTHKKQTLLNKIKKQLAKQTDKQRSATYRQRKKRKKVKSLRRRAKNVGYTYMLFNKKKNFQSALNDDIIINDDEIQDFTAGDMDKVCKFCKVCKLFKSEREGWCCNNGKTRKYMDPLPPYPDDICDLIWTCTDSNNERALNSDQKVAKQYARQLNSCLAMCSTVFQHDCGVVGFNPGMLKLQGNIGHYIGPIVPTDNSKPKFSQMWFYDESEMLDLRTELKMFEQYHKTLNKQRLTHKDTPLRRVIKTLQNVLIESNPYIRECKQLFSQVNLNDYDDAVIEFIDTKRHKKIYNRQNFLGAYDSRSNTANKQLCAVIPNYEPNKKSKPSQVIIKFRDNDKIQRINSLNPVCDPISYPILFPLGTPGYNVYDKSLIHRLNFTDFD